MLEIYKEKIYDLLSPETNSRDLKIKTDKTRGEFIQNLTQKYILDYDNFIQLLKIANENKAVLSTKLNHKSSRSHVILILEVIQIFPNDTSIKGVLTLVDLAGNEKISKSGASGPHLEQGIQINLGLSSLANVISRLSEGEKFIPYRDSKLTRILKDSLGGNSNCILIATCNPQMRCIEETISTLNFANKVMNIKNIPKINYQLSLSELEKKVLSLEEQVRSLKAKVKDLTAQLRSKNQGMNIIGNDTNINYNKQNMIDKIDNLGFSRDFFESDSQIESITNKDQLMKSTSNKSVIGYLEKNNNKNNKINDDEKTGRSDRYNFSKRNKEEVTKDINVNNEIMITNQINGINNQNQIIKNTNNDLNINENLIKNFSNRDNNNERIKEQISNSSRYRDLAFDKNNPIDGSERNEKIDINVNHNESKSSLNVRNNFIIKHKIYIGG